MFTRVTTTITTDIDLDTMRPEHSIDIEAEDGIPAQVAYAAALGAAKSLIDELESKVGGTIHLPAEGDDDD